MANEIEERVCNLLLMIVGYVTNRSGVKTAESNSSQQGLTSLLVDDTLPYLRSLWPSPTSKNNALRQYWKNEEVYCPFVCS